METYYLVHNEIDKNELYITKNPNYLVNEGEFIEEDSWDDFFQGYKLIPVSSINAVYDFEKDLLDLVAIALSNEKKNKSFTGEEKIKLKKFFTEKNSGFEDLFNRRIEKIFSCLSKYIPVTVVNLFESLISEGFDLPINHNKQSKDAMFSIIEKNLNLEKVESLDSVFDRYQIESKKSAFAQHRYPFWDKCVGNKLTRTHAKLIDIFSQKLATLIEHKKFFSEEEVEKLNGHDLWNDLAIFNPELFEILTNGLREKSIVIATPCNDSDSTKDVVFFERMESLHN